MRVILYAICIASLILITGCPGNNPADPGANPTGPKVGSFWTLFVTSISDEGWLVESRDESMVITETGLTYAGKNNVTRGMVAENSWNYLVYEPNGDLSMLYFLSNRGRALDSTWAAYPFGSKGVVTLPDWDTVDNGDRITSSRKYEYLGEETVTVAGETFQTKVIRSTGSTTVVDEAGRIIVGESNVDTAWYAPRIFFFVKLSGVEINNKGVRDELYYRKGELKRYELR